MSDEKQTELVEQEPHTQQELFSKDEYLELERRRIWYRISFHQAD